MTSTLNKAGERAVLITFGSMATGKPLKLVHYVADAKETVDAYLTTEAGIRYVQQQEAETPVLLYCFASSGFKNSNYTREGDDQIRNVWADINALQRTTPADDFEFVDVADFLTRDDQLTQLQKMQQLRLSGSDRIYIDMTGGKRDAAMMMISLVRFLQFQGIQPYKIIYSDFGGTQKSNPTIVNTTHLATVFNIFSAMDIFLKTGAARNLRQSINQAADVGWTMPKPLNDVLQALESFSDNIALCQAGQFQDAIAEILRALEAYHPQNCIYPESLFAMLVDRVRNEFTGITGDRQDLIATENWLLNHGLVQQALTLYTDQMPDLIYGKDNCIIADETKAGAAKSFTSERYNHLVNEVCGASTQLCFNRLRGYRLRVHNGRCSLVQATDIPQNARIEPKYIERLEAFLTIAYRPGNELKTREADKTMVDATVQEKIREMLGVELEKSEIQALSCSVKTEFDNMSRPSLDAHTKLLCRLVNLPRTDVKAVHGQSSTLSKVLDLVEENQFYFANYALDDWHRLAFVRNREKCCLVLLDYALMKVLRNGTNHGNGESPLTKEDVNRLRKIAPDHYTLRDGLEQGVKPADVTKAMRNALKNLLDCRATPKLK